MATSEEISVGAAVLAVLLERDGVFTFDDENRNGPEGFSWSTLCCFTPDLLWQEFS